MGGGEAVRNFMAAGSPDFESVVLGPVWDALPPVVWVGLSVCWVSVCQGGNPFCIACGCWWLWLAIYIRYLEETTFEWLLINTITVDC